MTNEELAQFIKKGENEELIPILWERVKKIMYIKSDRVYNAYTQSFKMCGVDAWDLKQNCYMAFLKAIDGYKPDKQLKFTSYLEYPFKTVVNELLGYRTSKRDPLNDCISLDMPLDDEHDNITLADTIADNNAVNAVETAEIADDYKIIHEAVDSLKSPMNTVINAYYFENKKFNEIGESMGVSTERIRQIKINAMRVLKNNNMLMQLYRENYRHAELKALESYRYEQPDKFVLLLERYKQVIKQNF